MANPPHLSYLSLSHTHTSYQQGKKSRTSKQKSSGEDSSSPEDDDDDDDDDDAKDDPEALKRRVDDVLGSIPEGATRKGLTSEEAAVSLVLPSLLLSC